MRTRPVIVPAVATAAAALALTLAGCGSSTAANRTSPTTPARPGLPSAPSVLPSSSGRTGAALLAAGPSVSVSPTAGEGTITTNGTGTVSGAPDTMTVSINVSTTDAHASAALAHNNAVAAAVQRALAAEGVAAKDIQTTGLSLQQSYPPSSTGYQVDDQVSATLRDLAKAGSAIDHAVAAAGDAGRLNGVSFSMSNTSPLMAAARNQAVAAARADAEQLAAAAGEHLGALVSLTDQPQGYSGPIPYASAAGTAAKAAPVPVQPGTQELNVVVTAVWAVRP